MKICVPDVCLVIRGTNRGLFGLLVLGCRYGVLNSEGR
jgi:hypothetical protein